MHLREALEAGGIGTFVQDYATGEHQWSPMCHRVFGTDPEGDEVSAELLGNLFHPDDRARIAQAVAEVHQGTEERYTLEFRIITPNGDLRHIRTASSLLRDQEGRVIREEGIAQDVTSEYRRLDEMLDVDKTRAAQLLLAGTIHDLNNQLMIAIYSLEEARASRVETPIFKDTRDALGLASELTRSLLRNLREQEDESSSSLCLPAFLRKRFHSFLRAAQPAELDYSFDDAPLTIQASELSLAQILFNLLINATEAGARKIEVLIQQCGPGLVRLVVRDDGPGIAPDILPHITKPWFSSKERGSGVGLTVVNTLCEKMGVALSLRNAAESTGLEVSMTFPLAEPTAILAPRSPRRLVGAGQRIIVADPNAVIARLLKQGLRAFDFDAEIGGASDEAQAYVVDSEHENIDAFLSKKEPVLVLCASVSPGQTAAPPRARWLQKPCSPVTLANSVSELLAKFEG